MIELGGESLSTISPAGGDYTGPDGLSCCCGPPNTPSAELGREE